MTSAQSVIVYMVCWWLLLFIALPIGIQPQEASNEGMGHGAPKKSHLGIKCGIVTLVAALATYAINMVINSGIIAVK